MVFKVLGLVLLVLVIGLVALYLYADNKADIRKGYNQGIETGGALEEKYLQDGPYAAKKTTAKTEDPIKKYTIYYPEELESADRTYPLLLVVNGTGGKATKYEPEFALYASWGFIAVGTQDKGTARDRRPSQRSVICWSRTKTLTAFSITGSTWRISGSRAFRKAEPPYSTC